MPSLLISAAVIVVAGAAMNVAVAWGSSLWSRLGDPQRQAVDRSLESGFGYEVESKVVTTTRTQMGCFHYPDGIQVENSTPRVIRMGWPLRSLSADPLLSEYYLAGASARRNQYFSQIRQSLEQCSETELAERSTKWQCGIRVPSKYLPDSALHGRRFAVRPIWPGFAINTVFYAGVLWLVFAAPFMLRRVIRRRRGRCPACGYPIGSSEVCTECGAAVAQNRARQEAAGIAVSTNQHG